MEKGANIRIFLDAEGNIFCCESFETVLEVNEEIAAQAGAGAGAGADSVLGREDITETIEVQIDSRKAEFIWIGKTQTEEDVRATEKLLEFVATERISKALGDRKTHKAKVWEEVAEHLATCGYKVADSVKAAGIKCHQKWRNLERSYFTFVTHSSANSKGIRKPPPQFEQLHSILEKKHRMADTGDDVQSAEMPHTNRREQAEDRQSVGKKILSTLQTFMQAEETRFEAMQNLLKKNLEAKKSLNRSFTQYLSYVTKQNRKRKRDYNSSSS